jgi:hypothetical protein
MADIAEYQLVTASDSGELRKEVTNLIWDKGGSFTETRSDANRRNHWGRRWLSFARRNVERHDLSLTRSKAY